MENEPKFINFLCYTAMMDVTKTYLYSDIKRQTLKNKKYNIISFCLKQLHNFNCAACSEYLISLTKSTMAVDVHFNILIFFDI